MLVGVPRRVGTGRGVRGGGVISTTLITSLIACVEPVEISLAISACYIFRAIGQIFGVAITTIQQYILISSLSSRFPSNPDLVRKLIQEPTGSCPCWTGKKRGRRGWLIWRVLGGFLGSWWSEASVDGRGCLYHDQREEALVDCVLGLLLVTL